MSKCMKHYKYIDGQKLKESIMDSKFTMVDIERLVGISASSIRRNTADNRMKELYLRAICNLINVSEDDYVISEEQYNRLMGCPIEEPEESIDTSYEMLKTLSAMNDRQAEMQDLMISLTQSMAEVLNTLTATYNALDEISEEIKKLREAWK